MMTTHIIMMMMMMMMMAMMIMMINSICSWLFVFGLASVKFQFE